MSKLRGLFTSMFLKLFFALALASTLVFTGLLYSALSSSRDALMEQKSDDMAIFIERTGQYLDLYLQSIRNILINVSDRMNDQLLDNPGDLEKLLREQLERNNGIVAGLFLRRGDGTIVSSDQLKYGIVGHPMLPDLFRMAGESPGIVRWSDPYYSPLMTDRTIAFALTLKNGAGTILAEINTTQLTRRIYDLLHNSGQGFALLTGKGDVVSYDPFSKIIPFKEGTLPPEMEDHFTQELASLPDGISRIDGTSGPLMVVKRQRNDLGWYLVTLTDERDFRAGTKDLFLRFLGIGALWFSLLLVFTLAISRHFTTPVNRLALQMDRIRGDRFTAPYRQIERKDEIGRLSRSFYTMIGRIQELVTTVRETEERKKAMEMELLLHQIRPHFLYNTLACIGSLAKQHRVQEVEETIRSLIGLLSYSIGRNETVTLQQELRALREYMQIQNVRYGDAFRLEVDVDSAYLQVPVLKLLLQPLVENAIFHGLASKGEGTVRVSVRTEEGRLLLSVWDNGNGMTEEKIESVTMPLVPVQTEAEQQREVGRFNSIGLPNVQERVRFNYGQEYGLRIRSEPGQWTDVTIVLPMP